LAEEEAMFSEFSLDPPDPPAEDPKVKAPSPEEDKEFQEWLSRRLEPAQRDRFTHLLLQRLKGRKGQLEQMLKEMGEHWTYEDAFYRYYHGSFKVYRVQGTTDKAVKLLREMLPERELNEVFMHIIREGTGKGFQVEHNKEWDRQTRPMLEAFAHAKFMVEMAVRYADLPEPPMPMPSGWAALLYLYDLR
jgi:hypothetical protein